MKFKKNDEVVVLSNQRIAKVLEYVEQVPDWGRPVLYAVIRYLDDRDKYNIAFCQDHKMIHISEAEAQYQI